MPSGSRDNNRIEELLLDKILKMHVIILMSTSSSWSSNSISQQIRKKKKKPKGKLQFLLDPPKELKKFANFFFFIFASH